LCLPGGVMAADSERECDLVDNRRVDSRVAPSVRRAVVRAANGLVQAPPVVAVARRATASRLRIVAYHDVPDPVTLNGHLRHLRQHYTPVDIEQVIAGVLGDQPLPTHAVWVTFDDGHPSTLAAAELLADAGFHATVFICPAVVDTAMPYWWQILATAADLELLSRALGLEDEPVDPVRVRLQLKALPDVDRRVAIDKMRLAIEEQIGCPLAVPQATLADLRMWVAAGHSIGNHSWDHPLLDRCDPREQRRQVNAAHEWLRERFPEQPLIFAYPNGNPSPVVAATLAELGYLLAALFDHRLARVTNVPATPFRATQTPAQLSRLRVDSYAPMPRLRSIVSGAHPVLFRALAW
jgi:peptidoglycan/xylan/chitin deacetylase (PgdA/CDA1 family)